MVAEVWEGRKVCWWWEARREGGHHGHGCEVEATWSAGSERVVVHGEVSVAVCIGPRGGDMRGVEDVSVDEVELDERYCVKGSQGSKR